MLDKRLRALILLALFVVPTIITIYMFRLWRWNEIHSSLWQLLLFAFIVAVLYLPGVIIISTLWIKDKIRKNFEEFDKEISI